MKLAEIVCKNVLAEAELKFSVAKSISLPTSVNSD
jgi:hypothetical protein